MNYIGIIIIVAFLITWGIFDYYTEVNREVSRWIRRYLWGPTFLYPLVLMKIFPLTTFRSEPLRMMAITYGFLLLFVSIPSIYCGHWAVKSYTGPSKRKAVIIAAINWVIGIGISIFIFQSIVASSNAGL